MIGPGRLLSLPVLSALVTCVAAPALAEDIEESDTQGWIQYEYQHRISERLRGSWSLGYREVLSTEDLLGEWSRLHLRGDFVYAHSRVLSFEAGIGGYYTFSTNPSNLFELRSWQGAIFFWPATVLAGREFDLRHRLRLEQRWTRQRASGETDFGLRLRYRLATFLPLNRPAVENKAFYLPLMGEAFADLGGETPELFAARLRLTAGLGYVLSRNWTLEFRYTAQRARDTVNARFATTDHILDLRIRTAVRIRDLAPSR